MKRKLLVLGFVLFLLVPFVSAPLVTSSKILIIGDSHLAGPYGKQLYNSLVDAGHEVNAYGCVSARASSYVKGGFSCNQSLGSTINNQQKDYTTQSIQQLITTHQPNIVIVSLGGNFITFPQDPREAKALLTEIASAGKGDNCYWIGPPWGPYGNVDNPANNEQIFKEFYIVLSEVFSEVSQSNQHSCKIFDSLKYTDHDFCPDDNSRRFCAQDCTSMSNCKAHYDQYGDIGTNIAKEWGTAVFQWLETGTEPPVSDILNPPGAVQPTLSVKKTEAVRGPSQAASLSKVQQPAQQPIEEAKEIIIIGCQSQQRCKEIDEVWGTILGLIVRGSSDIWDVAKNRWTAFISSKKVVPSSPTGTSPTLCVAGSGSAEMKALLDTIAWAEGTNNKYNVMYSGKTFNSLSAHPVDTGEMPEGGITAGDYTSTAAGRYQFVYKTYKELKEGYFKTGFGPKEQDEAALYLIKTTQMVTEGEVLSAVNSGDFVLVWDKLAPVWASLPYSKSNCEKPNCGNGKSYYAQPSQKYSDLKNVFDACLQQHKSGTAVVQEKPVSGFAHSSYTVSGESWKCGNEVYNPNSGLTEAPGENGCPAGMVKVDNFCIDKYEASLVKMDGTAWSPYCDPKVNGVQVKAVSVAGAVPHSNINEVQAEKACENAQKRLCTNEEWLRACQGPNGQHFPYGNELSKNVCNDESSRAPGHVINKLMDSNPSFFAGVTCFTSEGAFLQPCMQHPALNQQPNTVTKTGEKSDCKSAEGAYDMVGNLAEWTNDPDGTFRGGYYQDTLGSTPNYQGCLHRTIAHDIYYSDYSIGFRCCVDLGSSTTLTPSPTPTQPKTTPITIAGVTVTDDFCAQIKQAPQEQFMRKNYLPAGTYNEFTKFRTENYGYFSGFGQQNWNSNPPSYYEETTTFIGIDVRLNKKIVPALKCVEKELKEGKCNVCTNTKKYPLECNHDWKKYPYQPKFYSGFRGTNTYSGQSGEVSNHVYGIAIDIDPSFDSRVGNGCCGCGDQQYKDDPLCKVSSLEPYERMIMPACWVDVFNEYGFYWLGDDALQDNMHFEFLGDPTIIEKAQV